ncbi:MAG: hypothetical protein ACP5O7_08935 [Phycisphaerae bacterium]
MGRVPQNQDELARAILSGKLSLEDLRLEQARRQAAAQAAAHAAQAARAAAAAQHPTVAPAVKPAKPSPYGGPVAPTRRQVLTPSQQPAPVARRTPAAVPASRPPATRQPQPASATQKPAAAGQRAATATKTPQRAQTPQAAPAASAYALPHATERHGMFSVQNLRRAVIMSELLSKPLALRER